MRLDLEKLIELQRTDTNIRRLKKSIETAGQRRAIIEKEFERCAYSIRELQNKRDSLHAIREDLERQIAENKMYLERADRNLKHAQNQKVHQTGIRETATLRKQIAVLETQLLEKMAAIEEVEKDLDLRADEINRLEIDRICKLNDFDSKIAAENESLQIELKRRSKLFKTLPERLGLTYNCLIERSRDGVAVATVINGACSACFISLRPQLLVDVRKGNKILACENCTKILYLAAGITVGA